MDTTTLLALCGIAGILIILAALLLITVMRISIFGLANLILRAVINPKDEPSRLDNTTIGAQSAGNRWRSRDLRQRAQSADFDQAVARQRGQETPSIQTTPSPLPPNPAPPSVNLPSDPPRRRRKDDEDDGLLGGFVDGDDGMFGL